MVKTVAELIEDLKKLDMNAKVISNIYGVDDIREGIEGYLEDADCLHEKSDEDVFSLFEFEYTHNEEDAYWDACRTVANGIESGNQ